MKKNFFYIGFSFVLLVLVFALGANNFVGKYFSGSIKKDYIQQSVASSVYSSPALEVEKKLLSIEKKIPSKLKKSFDQLKADLIVYKEKFAKAEPPYSFELLDEFNHKNFLGQYGYFKDMIDFDESAKKFTVVITDLESKLKGKSDTKLLSEITKLKSDLSKLKGYYKKGDFDKFSKLSNALRGNFLKNKSLQGAFKNQFQDLGTLFEQAFPKKMSDVTVSANDFIATQWRYIDVGVCLLKWDEGLYLPTRDRMRDLISEVSDFYEENSYGVVRFNLAAYSANEQIINEPLPFDYIQEERIAVAQCDSDLDFASLDAVLVYPSALVEGGLGVKTVFDTDEGMFELPIVSIGQYSLDPHVSRTINAHVLEHEFAHAVFDLRHASSLDCGESVLNEDCVILERGNLFDEMGGSGHFNAYNKFLMGWLDVENILENGEYLVGNLELPSNYPQMLKIPASYEWPICVEYRKPIGFDAQHSYNPDQTPWDLALDGAPWGIPEEGCLFLNVCDIPFNLGLFSTRHSYLLDLTPGSVNLDGFNAVDGLDSCLWPGESIDVDEVGVSLDFVEVRDDAAVIEFFCHNCSYSP